MAHPRNSGLALRTFLKFCTMKRANRYIKILLVFQEKIHLGQFDLFRPFFTFDWVWLKLSQTTLSSQDMISFVITTESLNSQDMISILKQSGTFLR